LTRSTVTSEPRKSDCGQAAVQALPNAATVTVGLGTTPSGKAVERGEASVGAVFMSHSRADADITMAACAALEDAGILCWVAPRDILPSQTWSGAIVEAIGACRVFVVALSRRSNESVEVVREVELAAQRRKPMVTWRIEDVVPNGALEYFLSATQWQDAIDRPLQPRLAELTATVHALLDHAPAVPAPTAGATEFRDVDLDDFGARPGRVSRFVSRLLQDR
jgi:hypothetical protein